MHALACMERHIVIFIVRTTKKHHDQHQHQQHQQPQQQQQGIFHKRALVCVTWFVPCREKAAATTQTAAPARMPMRRNGPGRVATPHRPTGTEDGQGRAGEGRCEIRVHGEVQEEPSPQAAGAQYFTMHIGEDDGQAPVAGRPAPLRPQRGYERHCGSGFELVHDVTVPQLGRELVEAPTIRFFVEQTVGIPNSGWWWASRRSSRFPPQDRVLLVVAVEVFKVYAHVRVRQRKMPAPVMEYISPAPAVFPLPETVVEYIAPAPAVFPGAQPHGQAGSLPEQRSTAFGGAHHHDHDGFLTVHRSAAFRGAEHHDHQGSV